jgi:nucleotidyltransferase/DNA polymerase involved in DNA repair
VNRSRIACVKLPHVAVALEERDNLTLAGQPLVIEAPQPGPRTVYDLSYAAHLAGVAFGMTLTQARKVCPELTVLPARVEAYRDTFQIMLEVLSEYTPNIESADLEHSWMVTEGLTSGIVLERSLAQELADKVRHEVGLSSRVGLAHGKLTSKIVTQYVEQRDTMVLPPGKEAVFLGGLATRYLPMPADTVRQLIQLGLTKIHQYASLPSRGILVRFGYGGLRAYELAHGRDDARLQPWQEEPPIEAEHVFLEPIDNLCSLHHYIEKIVDQVSKPLATRFQMAGALSLAIAFEDGETITNRRTLVEPVVSSSALLTHADALMDDITWSSPVERITFGAQGLCPTVGRQLELFRRQHEARAGVEQTLERIQKKYGPDVIQQGHLLEPASPLPERRAYLAQW